MTLLQQLQEDAVNPQVDIMTLLRKARILAARLKNAEFEKWIKDELDGYTCGGLPDYRVLSVQSRATLIIGNGRLPAAPVMASLMPDKYRHFATTANLGNTISELASWAAGSRERQKDLHCPWPQELAVHYGGVGYGDDGYHRPQCPQAWQEISASSIVGIVETVRNRLLEFVLQIEAQAPDAGEAKPNQPPPLPQEKITQIFHTHVYGGIAHVAAEGAGNTLQIGGDERLTHSAGRGQFFAVDDICFGLQRAPRP